MAESDKEKESTGFWQMVGIFLLRTADSGLAPWTLVALFLLAIVWILTRHLESKDTLTLITKCGTFHGFIWAGWLMAFVEIPICRWILMRTKRLHRTRLGQLEDENKMARTMLKKYVAGELKLEP